MDTIEVFIECESGSYEKHVHDERTLEHQGSVRLPRPYPFPYGFIPNTTAADGAGVDCYVVTSRRLRRGATVRCEPIGLLEQFEDGEVDHKVLATLPGESAVADEGLRQTIKRFVDGALRDRVEIGRLLSAEAAWNHVRAGRQT